VPGLRAGGVGGTAALRAGYDRAVFAIFESIGGWELFLVGLGALLLFGKDLPKVAADAGAQLSKLRRGLDGAWRDSGLEREVRQIRDAIPRDLSLTDVARTASEKLAVRLEERAAAEADDASAGAPDPASADSEPAGPQVTPPVAGPDSPPAQPRG
jgi:Sec-independent protein translocase protein TatA